MWDPNILEPGSAQHPCDDSGPAQVAEARPPAKGDVAIALFLAVAGLYGVISYSVGQRTQEISIRMAMGAQRPDVLRQILRQGMALVVLGVMVGLVGAFAASGLVSGILVGVSPTNPVVYGGVTVLLLLVATLANYLPARRAAALDPMRALRQEL